MLNTLAIANYRSLLKLTVPLGQLNLIIGTNGSGKSSLYRALRLLAETAQGDVIQALAKEGGLESTLWAGPESLTRHMRSGAVPVQGGPRQKRVRLKLGFTTDNFGYAIALGLPTPSQSAFALDPEIKHECIWSGAWYRPASALVERHAAIIKRRDGRQWKVLEQHLSSFDSLFSQIGDPQRTPEVLTLRDAIRAWRFYDHFRTDLDAPVRQPQLGTRTPVLHHDGRDLAAALQTIREIGDQVALEQAIDDAFPGARLQVTAQADGRFGLAFSQPGLLRPLSAAELSRWHPALSAVDCSTTDPASTAADGAERAGNQPAP
ncbi:MAG: AAA family ATPase [Thiolinea sp.]